VRGFRPTRYQISTYYWFRPRFSIRVSLQMIPWEAQIKIPKWYLRHFWYPPNTGLIIFYGLGSTLPIIQGWALYYYLQSISHWGSKFPKLGTKSKTQDENSSQGKKNRGAKPVLLPEIGSQMRWVSPPVLDLPSLQTFTHSCSFSSWDQVLQIL
jgi:hypothetical protein